MIENWSLYNKAVFPFFPFLSCLPTSTPLFCAFSLEAFGMLTQ